MPALHIVTASLQRCNAEDPTGAIAVLEGVNLRNANLQGSNLNGVNYERCVCIIYSKLIDFQF